MTSERSHTAGESPTSAQSTPEGLTPEKESTTGRGNRFSISEVRQEMDKLWESIMTGRWSRLAPVHQTPPLDVFERDGRIVVRADLPGLTEDEVTVETDAEGIVISGERRDERVTKEENYYRSERTHGRFIRRIAMPPRAETDKATAIFRNGVLEIDMSIRPEPERRRSTSGLDSRAVLHRASRWTARTELSAPVQR